MVKLSKSKTGQYRVTIPPSIMTLFDLKPGKQCDWHNIDGFPGLKERKD